MSNHFCVNKALEVYCCKSVLAGRNLKTDSYDVTIFLLSEAVRWQKSISEQKWWFLGWGISPKSREAKYQMEISTIEPKLRLSNRLISVSQPLHFRLDGIWMVKAIIV